MGDDAVQKLKDLQEVFKIYDTDGSGTIENDELINVMRSIGLDPTDENVKNLLKVIDTNQDGVLQFGEFLALMAIYSTQFQLSPEELENALAFRLMDRDGDSLISPEEFRDAMVAMGQPISDAEALQVIQKFDGDNDGKVNYSEFAKLMAAMHIHVNTE